MYCEPFAVILSSNLLVFYYRPCAKYCFHRCLSVHIWGGGYPHLADGGYPHPADWGGGYPIQLTGGYPSGQWGVPPGTPTIGTGWGYPLSGLDGGTPHLIRTGWGYLPFGTGSGTPRQDWMGVPLVATGWGTPPPWPGDRKTEQLRGRLYASCVHTGGLSC